MRTTTAFFAGIGTVIAAIAAGLGGGLLLGDIMSPQAPKHPSSEVTRLEQRSSQPPISAMNSASQPVPYLATSQVAATIAEPTAQPQAEAPSQPQQPTAQPQQAAVQPQQAVAQPADAKPAPSATQPVAATEPPVAKERAAPEDSFAKARDSDLKREARRAEDRRKAERRQQWAEKRRIRPREDDELRDVEASVRETTEQRPLFGGPRFGARIGLFDD
jgi:hypothetical protein